MSIRHHLLQRIKQIIGITIGATIFAFGLNVFNIAHGLAEGGLTGFALLFKYVFDFPPGIFLIVTNIPLFLLGWRSLGHASMLLTIYGTLISSVLIDVMAPLAQPMSHDMLLAALYAGAFSGLGLGLIFRYGGTTGGSDLIARLVQRYWGISMGRTMFVIDAMVIMISMLTYLDRERAMYTIIAVYLGSRVIDFVQEGAYAGRMILIVSDHTTTIAQRIMNDLERGATLIQSRGAYTSQERPLLYCVVSRNEVVHVKQIIEDIDPAAFVVITDAHDIHGEGFTLDEHKRPLFK
ncbi:MAG: YitT family protein [Candidatus Carbobacillus sp.]|nr:YitT family protein [Candidatus Carbobacillus sp.]